VSGGPAAPGPGVGLSARLLALTILFVLVAEVLIFVPSIANFRLNWLGDRLASAQTAALVLEAAPDGMIPRSLERDVLAHVGAMMISVRQGEARRLLAFSDMPPMIAASFDLRATSPLAAIGDAFDALAARDGRTIRVIGAHPRRGDFIEIVMDERPLRAAMLRFAVNILMLSLAISAITAALVYLALVRLFVRPMRRLHASMMRFRAAPEDAASVIAPSGRRDEIGQAEVELRRMQTELQTALATKTHLAALGLAVAKINHDLRNMLAAAQLFSDRLADVKDATVQRFAPKLIGALDRAIALCRSTLAYGRASEPAPQRRLVALAPIAEEVGTALGLGPDSRVRWRVLVGRELDVDADPDQLFRVLLNLGRNGVEALEGRAGEDAITVAARREGGVVVIEVADTGPGVPEAARANLFMPFTGSARPGGTGLGLAIAAELVRGHGGTIALAEGTLGAHFLVTIPDRTVDLAARRNERASVDAQKGRSERPAS
jgi:hypothetical protein